jgi:acetyl esterase/lipase
MAQAIVRPPFDPALAAGRASYNIPNPINLEQLRQFAGAFDAEGVLKTFPNHEHKEYKLTSSEYYESNGAILSVFRSKTSTSNKRPCLYFIHGGGQIAGNRFSPLAAIMCLFEEIDVVAVTIEYRLAPDHPAPAGLEDCYAGLLWIAHNAEELGIDAGKILVFGGSGGAPLAAGCVLIARDKQYPKVYAQMLHTPMLDDRAITVSSKQFHQDAPWCGITNTQAWDMVLGDKRGGPNVNELWAPARAKDLSGLPPTFIDAGECEVFRDEAVAYASKMWECGNTAELHIWPGCHHGFDVLGRTAPVTYASVAARVAWIRRIFAADEEAMDTKQA